TLRPMPAIIPPRAASVATAVLAVTITATGCTSSHRGNANSTVTPSVPAASSPAESPAPASSSAPAKAVLPAGCGELLPVGTVERILGGPPLPGGVTYLRAAPVPQSGRTGRVTCGYGTPMSSVQSASPSKSPAATPTPVGDPLVEVSYITYVDAKTAKQRVLLTVQNDAGKATLSQVDVGGTQASVLIGGQWQELLMADGARTLVVEVAPTILPAAKAPAALAAMAKAMLAFGAPASSDLPSPSAASSS
ncbi:MAG: hypothetical protein ACRDV3_05110, partial [Acidothermaceae bacterium]